MKKLIVGLTAAFALATLSPAFAEETAGTPDAPKTDTKAKESKKGKKGKAKDEAKGEKAEGKGDAAKDKTAK